MSEFDKYGLSKGPHFIEVRYSDSFLCFILYEKAKTYVKNKQAKWIDKNKIDYWGPIDMKPKRTIY